MQVILNRANSFLTLETNQPIALKNENKKSISSKPWRNCNSNI